MSQTQLKKTNDPGNNSGDSLLDSMKTGMQQEADAIQKKITRTLLEPQKRRETAEEEYVRICGC